jgi:hypothetical protein
LDRARHIPPSKADRRCCVTLQLIDVTSLILNYTFGTGAVFTEVKSPGWEGELTQAERLAGRTKLPKYIEGDGGPFANWNGMRDCIRDAYGKFTPNERNLLVIADDFFVNLTVAQLPIDIALCDTHTGYGGEAGYFTSTAYQNVGGVAVFAATVDRASLRYRFQVFENPFALIQTKLPSSLLRLRG